MKNFLIVSICLVALASSNAQACEGKMQICTQLQAPCGIPDEARIEMDRHLGKCADALQSCTAEDIAFLIAWGASNERICTVGGIDTPAGEKIYMDGSKQAVAALSSVCLEALRQAGLGR
jgi:hypothetical protein